MKTKWIVYFAWFTVAQAAFHLAFELYAHVLVGQSFPSLVADLIAVGLPTFGVVAFLKWGWGPGLLCGGWGFEFCQYYRSWVWRVDSYLQGERAPFLVESIEFLSLLLAISAVAFLISVYLCVQHEKRSLGQDSEKASWIVAVLIGALSGVALRLAYKLAAQLPAGDGGSLILFAAIAIPATCMALWALKPPSENRANE